jgi:SAM-dependent methyltransferase
MENLNNYKTAYEKEFQFYFENHLYLGKYADLMCERILSLGLKSVVSLGIGHEVVGNRLIDLLEKNKISQYSIVEGAKDIIDKFLAEKINLNQEPRFQIHHSFFETFQASQKYDAIEMGFVLEHVDEPGKVISHFKQFLNPYGIIFISVPNAKSLHRVIGHEAGLLKDIYQLSQYDLELGHQRYFDLDSIQSLVSNCGLKINRSAGLMLKPITGKQMEELNWTENIFKALLNIGEKYPEISNCIYLEASIEE